jgi:hypothetical protein
MEGAARSIKEVHADAEKYLAVLSGIPLYEVALKKLCKKEGAMRRLRDQ